MPETPPEKLYVLLRMVYCELAIDVQCVYYVCIEVSAFRYDDGRVKTLLFVGIMDR